ncbi:hypothetical protein GCM10020000_29550 [Streptomyces olivoverticillatus]
MATLMGKSAELVVTLLAVWRLGAVHVPLFTAFAAEAITARTATVAALVADAPLTAKLEPLDGPWTVVVNDTAPAAAPARTAGPTLRELEAAGACGPPLPPARRGGDAPFVHLYTSGTTGAPKAVPVPVRAVAAFASYQHHALDHRADDVFWNMSDPGWGYGLYQAVVGPLALGQHTLFLASRFDPALTLRVLRELHVTNFAAAPPRSTGPCATTTGPRTGRTRCAAAPPRASRSTRTCRAGPRSTWAPPSTTTMGRRNSAWCSAPPGTLGGARSPHPAGWGPRCPAGAWP